MAGVRGGRAGSRAVPLLAQRAASEGPRWTRAVWPSPAACPKKTTGHQRERGRKKLTDSVTRQVTRARLGGDKKMGEDKGAECLACSQSPHDETVVARCAQSETVLPLALKSRPATGMGRERKGDRWTRAVWPSPATCPRSTCLVSMKLRMYKITLVSQR